MLDNLGFHTDRDYHAELDTLNTEINALTGQFEIGLFHSWEAQQNASNRLASLQHRADVIARAAAADDANQNRLAEAVRLVGDIDLGFIAYVVFGPDALPMPARYEIRLIERHGRGYTVPGTTRRDLTEDQLDEVTRELYTEALRPGGHARLWGLDGRDYRTVVTKY
ncbi:hypothetical protein [Streptomyces sp. NPDC096351]|uniref:hypothetical protein n=1 Tax=Streptomyces sp. NPDC096351 TaxID=3366087 RepID=UPI0038308B90